MPIEGEEEAEMTFKMRKRVVGVSNGWLEPGPGGHGYS